jgi:uncharacterized membrane protein
MGGDRPGPSDRRVEQVIGGILRAAVLLAAGTVVAGAVPFLLEHGGDRPHYRTFRGEPRDLRTVSGVLEDAVALRAPGILQLGVLLLLVTPVVRVAFAGTAFALQRDLLYVLVSAAVLGTLLFSLLGGRL